MTNPTPAADNLTMESRFDKWKRNHDNIMGGIDSSMISDLKSFIRSEKELSFKEGLDRQREEIVRVIQNRKPNEFAVRKYKTMEARTWDDKNLVIEALDDIISALTNHN